jgi:hypothetical protein
MFVVGDQMAVSHFILRLTAVFTGLPSDIGFQENPGSAAPVQRFIGMIVCQRVLASAFAPLTVRRPVFADILFSEARFRSLSYESRKRTNPEYSTKPNDRQRTSARHIFISEARQGGNQDFSSLAYARRRRRVG